MKRFTEFVLRNRKSVLLFWALAFLIGGFFSFRLQSVLQGSSDIIRNSPSDKVTQVLNKKFGKGSSYVFPIVMESRYISVHDPRFVQAAHSLEEKLIKGSGVRQVRSFWNSGMPELLGKDRKSAIFLVIPDVEDFFEAENLTDEIRARVRSAGLRSDFNVKVTGTVAMFHDLNRNSSSDLLYAERIGIPLTLVILLVVFGAPLAASLPLLLAMTSVTLSLAGLYFLSYRMPVSVFAQNAVSMIGLGVGVDYALFILGRFRQELSQGSTPAEAALNASIGAGHAVLFSGMTVAVGFMSLFLVNARFLHSLALGGVMVVTTSLATTLSLLPVLLSYFGKLVNWPRKLESPSPLGVRFRWLWGSWARSIMRLPWLYIIPAIAVLVVFVMPVFRLKAWNVGAKDLDVNMEARQGFEILERNFETGWMGPVILLIESDKGSSLWDEKCQETVLATAARLSFDKRVALIQGYPQILIALGQQRFNVHSQTELPEALRPLAAGSLSADNRTGLIILLTKQPPESTEVRKLVAQLRQDAWHEAHSAGIKVRVGGVTAMVADFDREMFESLWRVVPAVLALTFVVLLILFKSLLIPLKATILNLLSVLASYGFLVYVFQEGLGASIIGLNPPGGLNSFIVLMLFTILFGLSMDYEVFLLTQIREEYKKCGDNASSVATGVERTAGLITSAALIMVCLFGSFGLTRLTATREFGLGLAFAVFLDATLIRVLLVPALMELFGSANWWLPTSLKRFIKFKTVRIK
jgi:RND superfamily putative drug exporter